jgi:hypothetical protein
MKIFFVLMAASLSFAANADSYFECHERSGKSGIKEEIVINIVLKKSEANVYVHRFEPRMISFDMKKMTESFTRTGSWLTFDNGLSTLQIEASGSTRRAYFEKPLKCFEID